MFSFSHTLFICPLLFLLMFGVALPVMFLLEAAMSSRSIEYVRPDSQLPDSSNFTHELHSPSFNYNELTVTIFAGHILCNIFHSEVGGETLTLAISNFRP